MNPKQSCCRYDGEGSEKTFAVFKKPLGQQPGKVRTNTDVLVGRPANIQNTMTSQSMKYLVCKKA